MSEGNDGKVLLKCHAGCQFKDIVNAMGMDVKELFTNHTRSNKSRITEVYNYTDENGTLIYQVCRKSPKGFTQRRPNGNGGWIWNLKGVIFLIYRLQQTLKAIAENRSVFIVEGEKDADNLGKIGLTATCNSGGAGKWKPQFNKYFRHGRVIIIPDNDAPGHEHTEKVARNLSNIGREGQTHTFCLQSKLSS